jgi:hypothetical protein
MENPTRLGFFMVMVNAGLIYIVASSWGWIDLVMFQPIFAYIFQKNDKKISILNYFLNICSILINYVL